MAKRGTIFKRIHAIAVIMFILLMCVPVLGCGDIESVRKEKADAVEDYKLYKLSTYYYGDEELARLKEIAADAGSRINNSDNKKEIDNIAVKAIMDMNAVPNLGMRAKLYTLQEAYDQKIISKSTLTDLADRLNHAKSIPHEEMDPYLLDSAICWQHVNRYNNEEGLQYSVRNEYFSWDYYGECAEAGDKKRKYCFSMRAYFGPASLTREVVDEVSFLYSGHACIAVI